MSSELPVSELDSVVLGLHLQERGAKGLGDSVRAFVVGSDARQEFEVVSDPRPERVSFSLIGVKGLVEVGKLSYHEISIGQIAQSEALIAYETVEIVDLRLDLVEDGVFGLLPVFIKQQSSQFFEDIVQDSENGVNNPLILNIFAKELKMPRTLDDILGDG